MFKEQTFCLKWKKKTFIDNKALSTEPLPAGGNTKITKAIMNFKAFHLFEKCKEDWGIGGCATGEKYDVLVLYTNTVDFFLMSC